MDTAHIRHPGELRTEATHVRSGSIILTDAPVDNKGRGQAFSPTDLLATALGTCMITTMEIKANEHGFRLRVASARVVKHMTSGPRRVARVEVHLELDGSILGPGQRQLMEATALSCPVALSLHPDLTQEVHFSYL